MISIALTSEYICNQLLISCSVELLIVKVLELPEESIILPANQSIVIYVESAFNAGVNNLYLLDKEAKNSKGITISAFSEIKF